MSARPSQSDPVLRPVRALLHPLWLGSLAVLVLNDHVLKGAEVLPAAVTGKLSDFAGLIVAPALLAIVLRVTTRRGWLWSHAAVGLGFAAIQLSALAAEGWSAAMGLLGFPWAITRDATDLWALPALLVSAGVFMAVMQRATASAARRSAEVVAAGTGLLCCAATSPAEPDPFVPDLWTNVYFHNAGAENIVVRVRELDPTISVDCHAVAEDPGRLLTEPLFGNSQSYALEPSQNFGIQVGNDSWGWEGEWDDEGDEFIPRDCNAALVDIDGMPPAVVFWFVGGLMHRDVPGYGEEEGDALGRIEIHPSGDPDTLGEFEQPAEVLFLVPPAAPPTGDLCEAQSDAGRLYWSTPVPTGTWELLESIRGADGCYALELGIRNPLDEIIQSDRWYLCVPLSTLGIDAGRRISVDRVGQGAGSVGGVTVTTVDGTAEHPVPEGEPAFVHLQAYRGTAFPSFHGVQVSAVPDFDCGHVVSETCGTVVRATSVTMGGGDFGFTELQYGERTTLTAPDESTMTLALAHAEERAALDPACAEGPDMLGLDLEAVALYMEPATR